MGQVTLLGTSDEQIKDMLHSYLLYFVWAFVPTRARDCHIRVLFELLYLNNIQFHTSKSGLDRGTVYTY